MCLALKITNAAPVLVQFQAQTPAHRFCRSVLIQQWDPAFHQLHRQHLKCEKPNTYTATVHKLVRTTQGEGHQRCKLHRYADMLCVTVLVKTRFDKRPTCGRRARSSCLSWNVFCSWFSISLGSLDLFLLLFLLYPGCASFEIELELAAFDRHVSFKNQLHQASYTVPSMHIDVECGVQHMRTGAYLSRQRLAWAQTDEHPSDVELVRGKVSNQSILRLWEEP